jgi:phosphohistidine phosphatase
MDTPKRLIVMRHAKSSWRTPEITDHQRPLTKRGLRSAALVGELLRDLDWLPDRVCSSDAQRTRETWETMAASLSQEIEVAYFSSLYLAGSAAIISVLEDLDDGTETVLLLGHNPGWEMFASLLSGNDLVMKTADAVLLQTTASSWMEAMKPSQSWSLHTVIQARSLYNEDSESTR